jgi:hypothetical protein
VSKLCGVVLTAGSGSAMMGSVQSINSIVINSTLATHIAWLEFRLANEEMDAFTRCQVLAALALARGA